MIIKEKLSALGIYLSIPPEPVANFANSILQDNYLYLSGQGPIEIDGTRYQGKVGRDVSVKEAKKHARLVGINLLAVMNQALGGDLDRIERIIKILGFVNSSDDFHDQPEVINGCSDLFIEVFGEKGRHARSAIGVASLPFNITVEIEAIIAIRKA